METRQIKFRAWINPLGKMTDSFTLLEISKGLKNTFDNAEIMQFTRLKDKNGKEIYEGDIVMASQWKYAKEHFKPLGKKSDYEGIFLIEMIIGHWGMQINWKPISGYECSTHIMGQEDENGNMIQIEVIGNKFEDTELLK